MKIKEIVKIGLGITMSAFLLMACSSGEEKKVEEKKGLSDAEVAHVAVTANQIDIDYAAIAKQKSADSSVLQFAETMERDHKAVIAQAADLAGKLGVTPMENDLSKSLLDGAAKTKNDLNSKTGKDFDLAYINNEVAYHKAVIDAVEGSLIPDTDNEELKKLLQDVVPALKAHLAHAEMLQRNYKQ